MLLASLQAQLWVLSHWYNGYGGHTDLPKLVHETPKGLSQFAVHAQRVVLVDV